MYRALTITFVVLCTALAWWALELQGKLVFKEKELFELRKERAAVQEAEKQAQAEKAALLENVERLRKERDAAKGEEAGSEAATDGEANGADSARGRIDDVVKQMMPEVKDMIRVQQLAETRKAYGKLLKRWNLSSQRANEVLNILTERVTEGIADSISGSDASSDEETVYLRLTEFAKKAANEKLKAVIGTERIKELEDYEQEQQNEQLVSRYTSHLDITGSSLNPQQYVQFSELIRKEKIDLQDKALDIVFLQGDPSTVDQAVAKNRQSREEKQGRIIRDASTFLSPDQVSGLQSAFREENEQKDVMIKLMRESVRSVPLDVQRNREK